MSSINIGTLTSSKTSRNTLEAPVLVRLGYGVNSISLSWRAIPDATGYEIQRATNSGFTTALTTVYNGTKAGVTQTFQAGYTLEFHDTGLTANTAYFYRCRATGKGVLINWSSTKSITTGASNKTITVSDNSGLVLFGSDTDVVLASQTVFGGDTVALTNPVTGHWQYMAVFNWNGTPTEPILFRNQGQVEGPVISLQDCSYLYMDFSHASKTDPMGMSLQGFGGGECVFIEGLSHNLKILNLKTRQGAYALRMKNEANTFLSIEPACGVEYMWPSHIHDVEIGHWDCSEHSQDGFYLGSSAPWGGRLFNCADVTVNYRPTGLANIEIHHIAMSYTGRSGLQVGCMDLGTNSIHDCTITQTGFEYAADQGAGIAVGGANNNIEIYNNNISNTYREPVYTYNYGQMYLHDNIFDNAGTIDVDPWRVFFWTKITLTGGQTLDTTWFGSAPGKTIIDPHGEYFYEYFQTIGGNPIIKTQRISDTSSSTEAAIPTSHPTSVTLTVDTGRTYTVGQALTIVNGVDHTIRFTGTVTSYNSGTGSLAFNSTGNTGTGTYRNWIVYKTTTTPEAGIAAIGTTALGSHAGSQADPFVGFGSNMTITTGQVSYLTTIAIPGGFAVGNYLMNCFSTDSVDVYGSPAGLTTFRVENNTFGSQQAVSSKVISFLNTNNLYGTGNIICGNTYLGSPLIEANITKPGGGVVTYTLTTSC